MAIAEFLLPVILSEAKDPVTERDNGNRVRDSFFAVRDSGPLAALRSSGWRR